MITAGFPCQDISQAGTTKGLAGKNSSLVHHVFRLLQLGDVPHVILENVSFMLSLHGGAIMRLLREELELLGYRWAYRVLDSRAFGIPQRRERVFLYASRDRIPSELLFQEDSGVEELVYAPDTACGFYWTEGTRGLGWAVDAIPTLKGGSTIGIASPPAIWLPDGRVVKPAIEDAERLQGLPPNWTLPAEETTRRGHRWKLVGNAVTSNAAEWVGRSILRKPKAVTAPAAPFDLDKSWPKAAFGGPGMRPKSIEVSTWPVSIARPSLHDFLEYEPQPLSIRALEGFLKRLKASRLRGYPREFIPALEHYRESLVGEEDFIRQCMAN